MHVVLDLSKRHFLRRKGILTAIGTWLLVGDDYRPCLAIVRTGEEFADFTIPCVVTLDRAWIWSEEVGDEILAGHDAGRFMHALRLDGGDERQILRLLSIIRDNLGDLISMPPYEAQDLAVIAEMEIINRTTGRTREVEVRADV